MLWMRMRMSGRTTEPEEELEGGKGSTSTTSPLERVSTSVEAWKRWTDSVVYCAGRRQTTVGVV
jgi:hypothetical protein